MRLFLVHFLKCHTVTCPLEPPPCNFEEKTNKQTKTRNNPPRRIPLVRPNQVMVGSGQVCRAVWAPLTVCALLIFLMSHCCSPVKVSREMAPSELPHARIRPNSYGPQHTEFTAFKQKHTQQGWNFSTILPPVLMFSTEWTREVEGSNEASIRGFHKVGTGVPVKYSPKGPFWYFFSPCCCSDKYITYFTLDAGWKGADTHLTTRVPCIRTSCPRCRSPPSTRWLCGRMSRTPGCCRTWGAPTPPATRDLRAWGSHKKTKGLKQERIPNYRAACGRTWY